MPIPVCGERKEYAKNLATLAEAIRRRTFDVFPPRKEPYPHVTYGNGHDNLCPCCSCKNGYGPPLFFKVLVCRCECGKHGYTIILDHGWLRRGMAINLVNPVEIAKGRYVGKEIFITQLHREWLNSTVPKRSREMMNGCGIPQDVNNEFELVVRMIIDPIPPPKVVAKKSILRSLFRKKEESPRDSTLTPLLMP